MRIALFSAACAAWLLAACDSNPTDSSHKPAVLSVAGGGGQVGIVGAALGDSLTVRVADASGRGVAGVQVQFSTSAGSASPATAVTDAQGIASTQWTLGETTEWWSSPRAWPRSPGRPPPSRPRRRGCAPPWRRG